MSDDIPIIFAHDLEAHEPGRLIAVFASAASTAQMQQYATAQWRVLTTPDFVASRGVDPAAVPATPADAVGLETALLSLEGGVACGDIAGLLASWNPGIVKINCAFADVPAADAEATASTLAKAGYILLGTHWRDDNSFAFRYVSHMDRLAVFQPPDWGHLNLIGVRDPGLGHAILAVGRLYVGEERRIAELRVSHAIRGEHIARLEDALMAHQQRGVKAPKT